MNPFPRSVLGAAFHAPTIHKQLAMLSSREILLRLKLAAVLSDGNPVVVKRVLVKLQPRIAPGFLAAAGLFLESSDVIKMIDLTLEEIDLEGPWRG